MNKNLFRLSAVLLLVSSINHVYIFLSVLLSWGLTPFIIPNIIFLVLIFNTALSLWNMEKRSRHGLWALIILGFGLNIYGLTLGGIYPEGLSTLDGWKFIFQNILRDILAGSTPYLYYLVVAVFISKEFKHSQNS